ncbi:MAG TPA: nucleotide exchange factor GrpE [Candidatus Paceibacterota bacterium]|nr:nucleotide exchange factor GrpE [Candidatus Paceibacterota bacterium]
MADEENNLPEPTIADLKEQIEEVTVQRDEYLAGWQRSKADFINYKKEETARLQEISKYGSKDLIKDLILILDGYDLALRMAKNNNEKGIDNGIIIIRSQIEDILKKRGLEKIEISPGDMFDPAIAEAMLEIESEYPSGSVVEVAEPGYRLYEKVLRPARVIISKDKIN